MSAHLPLKPHIPVARVQIPPPFRKNPIFPEGRVVCTQANIPVTVWFIERKEEISDHYKLLTLGTMMG